MNKLIFKMPKFVVEKYLNEHFSEITEDEFFEILEMGINIPWYLYKSNEALLNSKKVLNYVFKKSPLAIIYFNKDLFDTELLEAMANGEFFIDEQFIINNKEFLENVKFREKALTIYPALIKYLKNEEITPLIIEVLEEYEYEIDIDDIENRPVLLSSDKLIMNGINVNPKIVRSIKNVSNEMIEYAIKKGLRINSEDLENNAFLRNNLMFIQLAYENDVRAIRFFTEGMLQYEVCNEAVKRGYIAREEDLLFNPILCDRAPIMEAAIKNNPSLIRYVTRFCGIQLNEQFVADTLAKYKITEEDLINNPELCSIHVIISKYPEYHLYSAFLTDEQKVTAIKNVLLSGKYEKLKNLPFFRNEFDAKVSGDNAFMLASILSCDIDDNDVEVGKKYSKVLDTVINGVVAMRYSSSKSSFMFSDIASLDVTVMQAFENAKKSNNVEILKNLAYILFVFVNMNSTKKVFITEDYLQFRVNDLYAQYDCGELNKNITTLFYNEILNKHRNCYCSKEKERVIASLKEKLPLMKKKKETIYNGRKIEKVTEIFVNKDFSILGVSEEDILREVTSVETELLNNKNLTKLGIVLDDNILTQLKELFLNEGRIKRGHIANILNTDQVEVLNYVFRKYEQIKLRFINKISLREDEKNIDASVVEGLGFNYHNFVIKSNDRALENIAKLLLKITDEEADQIMFNSSSFDDILEIIPLIDLVPELTIDNLIRILSNYDKIKGKLALEYDVDSLAKIQDIISLANGYSAVNDLYSAILGKTVVDKISIGEVEDYFNFYLNMYQKYQSTIPNVFGEFDGIVYESMNYRDPERLLIGINCYASCVDLTNIAGMGTYSECLLQDSGDVIMMRNRETGEFFARVLMFRRGNVVQLARIYDSNGKSIVLKNKVLKNIADQILQQSKIANDNIDYVFITATNNSCDTRFETYESQEFVSRFPHADYGKKAFLIGSSSEENSKNVLANIDYDMLSQIKYKKERQPILDNASVLELTRIKALRVAMEQNSRAKENLIANFESFYKNDYSRIISGEDWYVAQKNNGEIDALLLEVTDPRARIEFESALSMVAKINNSNTEDINIKR